MNSALHEIEGRMAMRRIEQESKARQVLANGAGARSAMLILFGVIFVFEGVGYFSGSRQFGYGALIFAGLVGGMLFSTNRRLESVITLLRLQDEKYLEQSDA